MERDDKMDNKNIAIVWRISLCILSVATIFIVGANMIESELSDMIIRIAGIIDLIALPVFAFATVKRFCKKNRI